MILALVRSSHAGPTVVVTILSAVLGLVVGVPPGRLVLLALAVLAGQLSIGWSNDAIDAARDRTVGRVDKPIARGEVSRRAVAVAAGVAVVVALGLSAALGLAFLAAHTIAVASAWAYNTGLKRTPLSVVPFAVSFGILPSLATLAASPPEVAPGWMTTAGAALGVAVHLANVLPDLEDDAATGVRGLPHRLGGRASAIIAAVAVVAGALAVALGVAATAAPLVAWLGFVVVTAVAVAALASALRRPSRTVFRLVMAAGLLLAVQLAIAAASLR